MRRIGERGLKLIQRFEGLRLQAYLCPAGVWTIGYGHTKDVKPGDRINEARAVELLREDCADAEQDVEKYVEVPLNQNQFDALVSFTFNLGGGALRDSTLRRVLNQGLYRDAADEMLRWNKAKGKVLPGLARRREAERYLFLQPECTASRSLP